jgi:hypothetical protein
MNKKKADNEMTICQDICKPYKAIHCYNDKVECDNTVVVVDINNKDIDDVNK